MLHSKSLRYAPGSHAGELRAGTASELIQVKVVLIEIVPPIWRRLRVPANLTLRRFHAVLQEAMGWKDLQPHRFRVGPSTIGKPSGPSDAVKDSRWITIQDVIAAGAKKFQYDYGDGANWVHEIRIEGRSEGGLADQRPVCLSGERACPPEDSTGPDEYVELISGLGSHNTGPGQRMQSASRGFDPDQFDVDEVNAALSTLTL